MKKLVMLIACSFLALHLAACTTSRDDGSDAPQVDGSLENPDGTTATAAAPKGNPDEAQAGFLDDQLPEDALGNKKADTSSAAATPPPATDKDGLSLDAATPPPATDASANPPPPTLVDNANPSPTPEMGAADMGSAATTPPPDATAMAGTTDSTPKADKPAKPMASLQKIKDVPYRQGKQLLNTVYIARPGDDYKKMSTMIYGDDTHAKDLKAANGGAKKVKPGQKIYYNSPKRPEDDTKMITYYEDNGMAPEVYVAKQGDDLKKVSKTLLGYPEAWKEVWATNTVESKGKLSEGTEIHYWKGSAAASMAAGDMPPPPTGDMGSATKAADQMAKNDFPPPPPPGGNDMKQPDMPPPPPPQQVAKQPDMPPPPPPPPAQQAAPPPPPPPPPPVAAAPKRPANKPVPGAAADGDMDQDSILLFAGAGVAVAAIAGLIIVRRRRARNAAAAGYETQVGA